MTGAEGRDWTDGEPMPFAEQEVLLPWLGTDEPLDERASLGRGRLLLRLILAAAVLTAVAGGVYWILNREEAPAAAIVTQTRAIERASIKAPGDESQTPGPAAADPPSPSPSELGTDVAAAVGQEAGRAKSEYKQAGFAAGSSGIGVQVGAYANRVHAELGWKTLAGTFQELQGVPHRVVQAVVGGKTVYRLHAVVPSAPAARELCDNLQASGADCWGQF